MRLRGRLHKRRRIVSVRVAAFLISITPVRAVMAQDISPETPLDIFEREKPAGMRVSPGLTLYPMAELDLIHDTNIYNRETPTVADSLVLFRPALSLKTDWSRHAMELRSRAELRRYFDTTAENSNQYELQAFGRLDLGQRITLRGTGVFARRVERRGTFGDAFLTDEPVAFRETGGALQIAREGGQFELSASAAITRRQYMDSRLNGVPIDLSLRDLNKRKASIRAGFRTSPRTRVFAELAINEVDYDQSPTRPRDSHGYSALGGIRMEISNLVDAEVAVGYLKQKFDDPLERGVSGLNYRAKVVWVPTPRLQFNLAGERSIERSPRADVSAVLQSDVKLGVKYALSDKLLLEAEGGYLDEDYRGIDRTDQRWFAQGRVRYRLAEKISVYAGAGYRKQNSSGTETRQYDGATFSAGLRVIL